MTRTRRTAALDVLLLFLLAAALIWPMFRLTYSKGWGTVESTFIADARYINSHFPHTVWQPLWYGGTRFDYIYPPGLRYGTALIARWGGVPEARAYHLFTALLYPLGIAAVYLFVRAAAGKRRLAWFASLSAALVSPAFLFIPAVRIDSGLIPQRLNVLARYAEGPHISSWSVLPLALAVCWLALDRFRPWMLIAAGALAAAVVSINFYGASALAVFYLLIVFSLWITRRPAGLWVRALAIPALAYGFTAFWLSPSFLKITLRNMQFVAGKGTGWSRWVLAGVAAGYLLLAFEFARGKAARAWPLFVAGSALFFSLIVLGWYSWDLRLIGEPIRFIPELDLALILLLLEVLGWLWTRRSPATRLFVIGVPLCVLLLTKPYWRHPWAVYQPDPDYRQRIEYRVTGWMAANMPSARAVAAGSIRFWYNAWHDLAQVGGGSEQGLLNPIVMAAQWEILAGQEAGPAIAWMQALGADAAIVTDSRSQEIFHDWQNPKKFQGVLPVAWDDGSGTVVYKVPRRYPAIARVVESRRLESLVPPSLPSDYDKVRAYADTLEQGPDSPVETHWDNPDNLRIRAEVKPGQSIVAQISYDPAWIAYSMDGARLPTRPDPLGMLRIDAPPGTRGVRLTMPLPLENVAGWFLTGWTVLVSAGIVVWARRRNRPAAA